MITRTAEPEMAESAAATRPAKTKKKVVRRAKPDQDGGVRARCGRAAVATQGS